ncbi:MULTISPECIES: DUF6213 family protein [Streptomyces]|uniref:DUF6213 family protein n=1 Tax=Streptomyces katrae TaxID=68223 RepID=A0ABT7GQI9_9ACTN|nr:MULTISPECIES: DUF6213 family protein [Streptomyces]MDK9495862.1 DUF6213 family protein [Streptomyces katrae]RST05105.1 hypothetical protein EF910_14255 [Streptomyces sp. WAC07149]GLX16516.1 hypothetical protein Slala01_01600 [Streptomyces lavendulae subsp. lavendulae]GLX25136.1 hypothetical protein Slala02_09560 [Streptomyces lavendulae subsp. lavendulae]
MNASIPLVSVPDGGVLIPADEVTGLLRHLAGEWLYVVYHEQVPLDPRTTLGLAGVLMAFADRIDAECIAYLPGPEEDPGR